MIILNKTQCEFFASLVDNEAVTHMDITGHNEGHYVVSFFIKVDSMYVAEYLREATNVGILGYYLWKLNIKEVKELLPLVIPYLVKRKEYVTLFNEFVNVQKHGRAISKEGKNKRKIIYDQIKKLKQTQTGNFQSLAL